MISAQVADLQAHLTNSEEHLGLQAPAARGAAAPAMTTYDALKTQGDQKRAPVSVNSKAIPS